MAENLLKFLSYLGWFLLLGVLPIWGVLAFMDSLSNYGLNRYMTDLATISSQMKAAFEGEETYGYEGEILDYFAIENNLVPADMIVRGEIRHYLGGGVALIAHGDLLEIIFEDLMVEDCINMLARTGMECARWGD